MYLIPKLNTQKNINSNLFLLEKKYKRTNLNSSSDTAYQCLCKYERYEHIITTKHMVHLRQQYRMWHANKALNKCQHN